jgi:hypothetical protein
MRPEAIPLYAKYRESYPEEERSGSEEVSLLYQSFGPTFPPDYARMRLCMYFKMYLCVCVCVCVRVCAYSFMCVCLCMCM